MTVCLTDVILNNMSNNVSMLLSVGDLDSYKFYCKTAPLQTSTKPQSRSYFLSGENILSSFIEIPTSK